MVIKRLDYRNIIIAIVLNDPEKHFSYRRHVVFLICSHLQVLKVTAHLR